MYKRQINKYWVFYHPNPKEGDVLFEGKRPKTIILSEKEANHSIFYNDCLYISEADLWIEEKHLMVSSTNTEVRLVEKLTRTSKTITFEKNKSEVTYQDFSNDNSHTRYKVNVAYSHSKDSSDVLLKIDFIGDRAELYDDKGKLLADWFTTGKDWTISLKTFDYPETLELKVYPSSKDTYYERPNDPGCGVNDIRTTPLYMKKVN